MTKKVNYIVIILIIMIAALGVYRYQRLHSIVNVIENAISLVAYPFVWGVNKIAYPFQTLIAYTVNYKQLTQNIIALTQERDHLLEKVINYEASRDFNQQTQELIDFQKRYKHFDKKLAHVILKQFSPEEHFYLIDKGSVDGVTVDMIAVYKNCLLGRVVQVYPYYSKVLLITDMRCKIAGICAKTKTNGILEGTNTLDSSVFAHVSHLDPIELDDLVLSSGQGLVFPRGFGLARITESVIDGPHKKVRASLLVDFSAINYCYVMKKI